MDVGNMESTTQEVELCSWCGIPLGSANTVRELVCIRCYKLLTNAGLKDSEIFSDQTGGRRTAEF